MVAVSGATAAAAAAAASGSIASPFVFSIATGARVLGVRVDSFEPRCIDAAERLEVAQPACAGLGLHGRRARGELAHEYIDHRVPVRE
jgi:hypothetical protein